MMPASIYIQNIHGEFEFIIYLTFIKNKFHWTMKPQFQLNNWHLVGMSRIWGMQPNIELNYFSKIC